MLVEFLRCICAQSRVQLSASREVILSADSEEDFDDWATVLSDAACSMKGLSDDV